MRRSRLLVTPVYVLESYSLCTRSKSGAYASKLPDRNGEDRDSSHAAANARGNDRARVPGLRSTQINLFTRRHTSSARNDCPGFSAMRVSGLDANEGTTARPLVEQFAIAQLG